MRTLWIVAVLLVGVEGSQYELRKMILQETGKNAVTSYGLYGCNCGVGDQGPPMDATDRCCFVHKCCYKKLTNCNPQRDRYSYSWKNGAIVCGEDNACKKQMCECDKAVAICLRENLNTYNNKYKRPIPRLIEGVQNKHTHKELLAPLASHRPRGTARERCVCFLLAA